MRYAVIIAGAGPAGTTTAWCLQRAGKRCLLVEEKTRLEEKTCGGLLTWSGIRALEDAGLEAGELLALGAVPIRRFVYLQKNGTKTHQYHAGEYALGLTRHLLDSWLLDHALAAGAAWKPGTRLRKVVRRDGVFHLGGDSAGTLVIATGAAGLVPRGMASVMERQSFGLSAQIRGNTLLDADAVYFHMVGENSPDYFWLIPNGNELWNIGIWFRQPPKDAAAQFRRYKAEFVDTAFSQIEFVRPLKGAFCGHADLSAQFPEGCHTVGDAAGQNQAATGEGLRYAITSAAAVADQICKEEEQRWRSGYTE